MENKEFLLIEYLKNLELPDLTSRIDGESFKDLESLHRSFKKHKIKIQDYYEKYYPRWDIVTRQKLEFKNIEKYFITHFADKKRLNTFIISYVSKELKELVLGKILWARRILKKYNYFPGEAECDTFHFPNISKINKIGLSIENIANHGGVKIRYDYKTKPIYRKFDKDEVILQDTREQKPLKLKEPFIIYGLEFGDYCASGEKSDVAIERKSLNDFVGTLSSGYERFNNECVRALQSDYKLVVLIEASLVTAKSFPFIVKHTKASPDFIFHRMRDLINSFQHVQFLFVEGRVEAASIVPKLLKMIDLNNYDLQFLYNQGLI